MLIFLNQKKHYWDFIYLLSFLYSKNTNLIITLYIIPIIY